MPIQSKILRDSERQSVWDLGVLRKSLARQEALTWLGKDRLVELEIGSNLGDFLLRAGRAFPETYYIGTEVSAKLADPCGERLLAKGITNARVIHSEGIEFLRDSVPAAAIQRVHIFFPTPYHRVLGLTRPLLRAELFHEIHRVLVPHGTLNILVDRKEDARKVRILTSSTLWQRKRFTPLPLDQEAPFYVGTPSEVRYGALRQIIPFRLKKIAAA